MKRILFLLLISTCIFNSGKAQNTGPTAPEAMGFEPVDATDMVNLVTGNFSYVLPLLNIPGVDGGYPIALSYHGGVGMDQEASWVGLGWNINPGAIDRTVNGIPDDVKDDYVSTFLYNPGESYTVNYAGILIPLEALTIGISATWGDAWSMSGTVGVAGVHGTAGFGSDGGIVGAGIGIPNTGFSAGFDVQGSQASISASFNGKRNGPVGLQGKYNLTNNSFSGGVDADFAKKIGQNKSKFKNVMVRPSVGISLSSKGLNYKGNVGVSSTKNVSSNMSNSGVRTVTSSWGVDLIFLNFGQHKHYVWYASQNNKYQYGSLYNSDSFKSQNQNSGFSFIHDGVQSSKHIPDVNYFPIYEDEAINNQAFNKYANLGTLAYDFYNVNAQGISGNMKPRYLKPSLISGPTSVLTEFKISDDDDEPNRFYNFYKEEVIYYTTAGYADRSNPDALINTFDDNAKIDRLKNSDRAFFYMEGYPTSGVECLEVAFENFNSTKKDPIWGDYKLNAISEDGYYKTTNLVKDNRRVDANFVEYFTNSEIINNTSLLKSQGFIEAKGLSVEKRSDHSKFSEVGIGAFKVTGVDGMIYHYSLPVYQYEKYSRHKNSGTSDLMIKRNEGLYATAWLLTAITGPDYIDVKGDGLSKDDYGYWVEFEYGEWTDGYYWRFPYDSEETNEWGRKQLYYLNSIKTKTHIAYFVKDIRYDGKSAEFNESYSISKAYEFEDQYMSGHAFYTAGTYDLKVGKYFGFEIKKRYPLKLSKIILVENNQNNILNYGSGDELIDDSNSSSEVKNKILYYDVFKFTGNSWDEKPDWNYEETLEFSGHFEENVLDINDIDGLNFESKALRIIEFGYKESGLVKNTPNSDALNGTKLTLNNIQFKGEKGVSMIPPYSFVYHNEGYAHSKTNMDEWGYSRFSPSAGSLSRINLPIGGSIDIEYESDDYLTYALFNKVFKVVEIEKINAGNNLNNGPGSFTFTFKVPDIYDYEDFISNIISVKVFCSIKGTAYIGGAHVPSNKFFNATVAGTNPENKTMTLNCSAGSLFPVFHNIDNISDIVVKVDYTLGTEREGFKGGGVRVKNIEIYDNLDLKGSTNYTYKNSSGKTSGVTTYAPLAGRWMIPFKTEIPGPEVFYKYVSVNQNLGEYSTTTSYEFEIPQYSNYLPNSFEFAMGSQFRVEDVQDQYSEDELLQSYQDGQYKKNIRARSAVITNKTNQIGRLNNSKVKNNNGETISEIINTYGDIEFGVNQETFYSLKSYVEWDDIDHSGNETNFFLVSTSVRDLPSVLLATEHIVDGISTKTYYEEFDPITGLANVIRTEQANGDLHQIVSIPAYTINDYSNMGSKVDDISNKNMLTQNAAAISYKYTGTDTDDPDHWSPLEVSLQTWKGTWDNYVEWNPDGSVSYSGEDKDDTDNFYNIWRKHRSFVWDGSIDEDGYLEGFESFHSPDLLVGNFPAWDADADLTDIDPWQMNSEIVRYNHHSSPVEVMDISGDYASSKKDPDGMHVAVSAANASYASFGATSFEFAKLINSSSGIYLHEGDAIMQTMGTPTRKSYDSEASDQSNMITNITAHTGNNYAVIASGAARCRYKGEYTTNSDLNTGCMYRASVWVHKNKENWLQLRAVTTTNTTSSKSRIGQFGNWVLYYLDFQIDELDTEFTVFVETTGGEIYIDDFRVHPFEASVNSYTYDKSGNVTAIINNDNFATKYEYDAAGRLIATFRETINGFVKTSTNKYNYWGGYNVNYDEAIIPVTGGTTTIEVSNPNNNNITYILTDDSWLTEVSKSNHGISLLAPSYDECDDYRSTEITVINESTKEEHDFTIMQQGLSVDVDVSETVLMDEIDYGEDIPISFKMKYPGNSLSPESINACVNVYLNGGVEKCVTLPKGTWESVNVSVPSLVNEGGVYTMFIRDCADKSTLIPGNIMIIRDISGTPNEGRIYLQWFDRGDDFELRVVNYSNSTLSQYSWYRNDMPINPDGGSSYTDKKLSGQYTYKVQFRTDEAHGNEIIFRTIMLDNGIDMR